MSCRYIFIYLVKNLARKGLKQCDFSAEFEQETSMMPISVVVESGNAYLTTGPG